MHGAAFAEREDLARPFVETSREGFRKALDVSAYSLVALARRAAPLMDEQGGGSILTLSYLGAERVFPNYNVMGVAKAALEASVRYLASRPRSEEHSRERDLGRPDQDAGGVRHFRVFEILQTYRDRAPLRRTVEADEVADAALFLLGPPAAPSPAKC